MAFLSNKEPTDCDGEGDDTSGLVIELAPVVRRCLLS